MIVGVTAYMLGVFAGSYFYKAQYPHRTWLVLLPVLPLIYIAATIMRHISEKDEMWRKIITEAFAFSAIATGFTCASYVFFRALGAPEFHAEWVICIMAAYSLIGMFFSGRKYFSCQEDK
jgi:membrane protein DedA with SNARE-associated domain